MIKKAKYNSTGKTSKMEDEFVKFLKSKGYDFKTQVPFKLQEGFTFEEERYLPINYVADVYFPEEKIALDFKGVLTPLYKIKKKLFISKYKTPLYEIKEAPKYIQNILGSPYIEDKSLSLIQDEKKKLVNVKKLELNTELGKVLVAKYEISRKFDIVFLKKKGGKK